VDRNPRPPWKWTTCTDKREEHGHTHTRTTPYENTSSVPSRVVNDACTRTHTQQSDTGHNCMKQCPSTTPAPSRAPPPHLFTGHVRDAALRGSHTQLQCVLRNKHRNTAHQRSCRETTLTLHACLLHACLLLMPQTCTKREPRANGYASPTLSRVRPLMVPSAAVTRTCNASCQVVRGTHTPGERQHQTRPLSPRAPTTTK
jgi:hypothetical protein